MKKLKGKLLYKGGHRLVFEHKENPDLVIKEQFLEGGYNKGEYETFLLAEELGVSNWLAPVIEVSEDFKYLIMVRGDKINDDEVPKNKPKWLDHDASLSRNWVKINGEVKLCDYDHNQARDLKREVKQT